MRPNPRLPETPEEIAADAVRRETADFVFQHSTGGTGAPLSARRASIRTDPAPEMAGLDVRPPNRYDHGSSEDTRAMDRSLATEMRERGIGPEIEVFNDGHPNERHALLDGQPDLLPEPPYVNLIFGGGTLSIPSPRNLLNAVDNLPDGAEFDALGFGRHQLPLTTMSVVLCGHVRVGLEDNVYYRRGELAESSAQLVERAARIAEELGRPVA